MNLQHLIYFCELAKTPHMPTIAEKEHISQSTLSYAISKLEDELGVPLFIKHGRNIELSSYGKIFYQYANDALASLNKGKNKIIDLSLGQSGKIGLGGAYIIDNDFLTNVISSFRADHPKEKINFELKIGTSNELITSLEKDQIQLAILPIINQSTKTKQLDLIPLFKRQFIVVVPPNNPLAKQKNTSLKELISYPIIGFSTISGIRPRLDELWKANHLSVTYQAEANDVRTILNLVKAGEGIALIPKSKYFTVAGLDYINLIENANYTVYLAHKKDKYLPEVAKIFANYIQNYCLINKLDQVK